VLRRSTRVTRAALTGTPFKSGALMRISQWQRNRVACMKKIKLALHSEMARETHEIEGLSE
jgi:hypothetical protein